MYLKRESNLTEKLCQHYRQGSVQVLHQQVFPDFASPPASPLLSAQALNPPPLIC